LAENVLKPILRGIVKTAAGFALEVKRVATEAGKEFQDIPAR